MEYRDFVIEVKDAQVKPDANRRWWRSMQVRVLESQATGKGPQKWIATGCDEDQFLDLLKKLEADKLERAELFSLGRVLSLLLMPISQDGISGVREQLIRSMDLAGVDTGVRIRLMLPPEVASLPWEYTYLDRTGSAEDTMLGFLALDPRVAIVRHESLAVNAELAPLKGDIEILAALASPRAVPGIPMPLDKLDVVGEAKLLSEAFQDRNGKRLHIVQNATLESVDRELDGISVFHFAGHGAFRQMPADKPGQRVGSGLLVFDNEAVDAEKLGVNLRGKGVRLAVLGGCETGRRVGPYTSGSVAVGLVMGELPAVVANQYSILDTSAAKFARAFYTALDGGLPVEAAVHAGRLAVFNAKGDSRDWGVPVLYLRARNGELFAGLADEAARMQARSTAEADVKVRTKDVAAGGFVTGAKLREMISGKLTVDVTIDGTVYGTVVGYEGESITGGNLKVEVNTGSVGTGGKVVGADLRKFGAPPEEWGKPMRRGLRRSTGGDGTRSAPPAVAVPAPQSAPTPRSVPPPSVLPGVNSTVNVENLNGGTAIGTKIDHLQVASATIFNPAARDPDTGLMKQMLRLDVGAPRAVTVDEPFDLRVQVKLPGSLPMAATAGEQVTSAGGSVFRRDEAEVVRYKIVPGGQGFSFNPPTLKIPLAPNSESQSVFFEAVSSKPGARNLLVNAYQDEDTLVAQTKLTLEVSITTQPK